MKAVKRCGKPVGVLTPGWRRVLAVMAALLLTAPAAVVVLFLDLLFLPVSLSRAAGVAKRRRWAAPRPGYAA